MVEGDTVGTEVVVGVLVGGEVGNLVGLAVVGTELGEFVGALVGSEVGDEVGQPVPTELSVVISQPLETALDRAATSVGRSEQRLFEWSAKPMVTFERAPSCVGMVDESKFEFSAKPLVRATRLPSSVGIAAMIEFAARLKLEAMFESEPSSVGMAEESWFELRKPSVPPPSISLVRHPISVGMGPSKLFCPKSSLVTLVSSPNSVGSVPLRPWLLYARLVVASWMCWPSLVICQQGAPMKLLLLIKVASFQLVTPLARAWTSVGTSSQSRFVRRMNDLVSFLKLPS